MSMDINIIKKKILNLINVSMNIRRKTYNALKHIVNRLNDGTYYVNINFNVCLHNNNLFHIYKYIKWRIRECCSQLVRWTLNWNKGRNIEQNIFSEFSAWVWARLSLSPLHYKAAVVAI